MDFKLYVRKKNLILGILTLLITVCFTMTGYSLEYKNVFLCFGFVFSIVYAFALVYYEKSEDDIEELKGRLEQVDNNRKALECMMSEVQTLLESVAEVVRRHSIADKEICWDYDRMCSKCCESVYRVLDIHCLSKVNFSVSYVTKLSYEGDKVKLNAYKNTSGAAPSVYQKKRKLDNNGHFDLKIFKSNNPEYVILLNKEEILSKFQIHNQNSGRKYNQYVALPVVDNTNTIVGVLQIIAFEDASLGTTFDEVRSTIITFFRPFLPVFLLLYQINYSMHNLKGGEENEGLAKEEDQ